QHRPQHEIRHSIAWFLFRSPGQRKSDRCSDLATARKRCTRVYAPACSSAAREIFAREKLCATRSGLLRTASCESRSHIADSQQKARRHHPRKVPRLHVAEPYVTRNMSAA